MAAAALLAALATGCQNPFGNLNNLQTTGYVARDLLPADRGVGSWRREKKTISLSRKYFQSSLGADAGARLKHWSLGTGVRAGYRLGKTGRTLVLEVYDLGKPAAAFDIYSLLREQALKEKKARVTKVGAQGLLYAQRASSGERPAERALVFWVERFLVKLTHGGGTPVSAEATLLAFGNAVTAKVKKPYELAEAYVLQIKGEVPNSERFVPRRVLGRAELPSGVIARWQGKSGEGLLFISVRESEQSARRAFDKLRRASGGTLSSDFAGGLFVGNLPGFGPVACFRRGKAIVGLLAGAADAKERMAVLEAVRKRCAGGGRP